MAENLYVYLVDGTDVPVDGITAEGTPEDVPFYDGSTFRNELNLIYSEQDVSATADLVVTDQKPDLVKGVGTPGSGNTTGDDRWNHIDPHFWLKKRTRYKLTRGASFTAWFWSDQIIGIGTSPRQNVS